MSVSVHTRVSGVHQAGWVLGVRVVPGAQRWGPGARRTGSASDAGGDASAACGATGRGGRGVLTESGLPNTSVNRFLLTFTRSYFAAVIFRESCL